MSSWRKGVIGDEVSALEAGVSVNSDDRPHGIGEVGVLKTSALSGGVFNAKENKAIWPRERTRAQVSPEADSILVSRMNTPALVGESAYVADDWPELFLPDRIWQLRMRDRERCCVRWVAHLLQSHSAKAHIALSATGTSGSMKNLPMSRLLALPVAWPPSSEQRCIAEILDTMNETIRKTEQLIDKLNQLKKGLLHDLFTRGIANNGELRDPIRRPEEFKDSPLGLIPRQWTISPLEPLLESSVDGPFGSNLKTEHYVAEPGVRLVRLQNIGEGTFLDHEKAWISEAHARSLARHDVRAGDVLVASLGDPTHQFARSCMYPPDHAPGIVKADCFRLRTGKPLEAPFLSHVLNTPRWRAGLAGLVHRSGVSRDRVNLSKLRRLLVPLPPAAEQRTLIAALSALDRRLTSESDQVRKLEFLKHGLMDDLLTGRVRVAELLSEAAA